MFVLLFFDLIALSATFLLMLAISLPAMAQTTHGGRGGMAIIGTPGASGTSSSTAAGGAAGKGTGVTGAGGYGHPAA
jgi:hypothetical protein